MKSHGRIAILAALVSSLVVPAGLAQSSQSAQNPQNTQDQSQSQSQSQDSGVSHPPPDSTIEADEDTTPTPAPTPKPSPAIPMTSAAPLASAAPAVSMPAPAAASSANSLDNTDYGIVTVVPSQPASGDASLQTRNWNPNDDIVNYVPSGPNELASGTNLTVRLSEDLSTDDAHRGQTFRGVIARNVYKDGRIIIPAGSGIRGRVVEVSQGHHIGPHATLRLRPEAIILPDGTMYQIDAEAVQSLASGTRTDNEGGIEAGHHFTKDAVEYGSGAGVGAVAGAEIAGPVGAGVGSLVGAGLVSAHMLMGHPEAANLPQGSILVFSLTQSMSMTPTHD
ncbi:MAG TPA: hypothetical protein VHX13_09670 [Acidobacteriaceae bacterium]|jgi:hypothetical protein|nr:hypothetical protein [Acidobacteriaceae bacterium]